VDTLDDEAGAVTLMTLHAAKGLEFPVVYIVGLEDGLLPFRRDDESPADIEEERRLCFVGMTRAKEELTLTHARYRMRHGQTLRNVESEFLGDLPADELEWCSEATDVAGSRAGRRRPGRGPSDEFHPSLWGAGTLVYHDEYGLGQVVAIRPGAALTHVTVGFERGGEQDFILEYADLIRLEPDEVG
jgi:DNA helicase-2/ATP-dependent DNA helicase PcrA